VPCQAHGKSPVNYHGLQGSLYYYHWARLPVLGESRAYWALAR
jgi:hypothetical protein